jgi:hypothetical protein
MKVFPSHKRSPELTMMMMMSSFFAVLLLVLVVVSVQAIPPPGGTAAAPANSKSSSSTCPFFGVPKGTTLSIRGGEVHSCETLDDCESLLLKAGSNQQLTVIDFSATWW